MATAQSAAQAHDFQPVGLGAPSARPDEPVTAGLSTGPGPGPEALSFQNAGDSPVAAELRALYRAFPNPDLGELLEDLSNGVTF